MLIYDGVLNRRTSEWIMSMLEKYPCVVELIRIPDYGWIEENLPIYRVGERSAMGSSYTRETRLYGTINNESTGTIFFFTPNINDHNKILKGCENLIVNKNPFKTVLK